MTRPRKMASFLFYSSSVKGPGSGALKAPRWWSNYSKMLVLLLLLVASPSFAIIRCHNYLIGMGKRVESGPTPCDTGRCIDMTTTLSDGSIFLAGSCDKDNNMCRDIQGTDFGQAEFIQEFPSHLTVNVTSVKCCTTDECNAPPPAVIN